MGDPDPRDSSSGDLELGYRGLVRLHSSAFRGQADPLTHERELEVERLRFQAGLFEELGPGQPAAALEAALQRVARHLLDFPPLVDDPVAADLEASAAVFCESPEPALREAGTKLAALIQRQRELSQLRPVARAVNPSPSGASLEELLEAWPERPSDKARDLRHRALVEFHKGKHAARRGRRRAVAALVDLANATSWEPHHPWRLALLEAARDLDPDDPEPWFQVARHLKAYGELAEARRTCRRALDLDGRHAGALALLGSLLEHCARPREALDAYARLLRTEGRIGDTGPPGRPGKSRLDRAVASALEGCARLRLLLGDPGGSLEASLELVRRVPGDTRTLRGLEALARKVGALPEAERLARDLAARGGRPGGPPPAAWERYPDGVVRDLVRAKLRA